jgi:hypothetical protein
MTAEVPILLRGDEKSIITGDPNESSKKELLIGLVKKIRRSLLDVNASTVKRD